MAKDSKNQISSRYSVNDALVKIWVAIHSKAPDINNVSPEVLEAIRAYHLLGHVLKTKLSAEQLKEEYQFEPEVKMWHSLKKSPMTEAPDA